ncbi:Uncharacterised protein [Enterobacter hormaechei]|uniref:ead/Ea22-like family protein n=1 Tax=Enterobacter hormaechei TaxID=158836 RepID=UPI00079896AF|nr:ead/Ea22-like family protein [Enterobacter hormaechei]SAH95469.1 Uncharacterised protein [Enterobacter hormaechei]
MSNIDKRALRERAESTIGILENIAGFEPSDIDGDTVELRFETEDGFDTGCEVSIVDQCQKAADVIRALLDELEAAEERYVDMLRQARSFREAHDSASEIIRKLERNKPTVKLPTTRLWAGKIACYEESEVVAMLEIAGINIAAAGKGE